MKDLIDQAKRLNQPVPKPIPSKRPKRKYQPRTIQEASTMDEVVQVINANPDRADTLAACALHDFDNIRDMSPSNILAHCERILAAGGKFDQKNALDILYRALDEKKMPKDLDNQI